MSKLPSACVVAWEIRVKIYYQLQQLKQSDFTTAPKTVKSTLKITVQTLQPPYERERGKTEIWRSHFQKLLKSPMDLRDRLIVESALLQALRPGEISSLRAEWFDFDHGDLQILDSKKGVMFTRPIDPIYGEHSETYMIREEITHGIFIQPKSNAHHTGRKQGSKTRGEGLSCSLIERIFKWRCMDAGVPPVAPRVGRAYWICNEHYVLGKPLAYCSWFLRHDSLQSTEHYVYSRIVDCESMKQIFYQGRMSPTPDACVLMDHCDLSEFGCHCRMFQPRKIEQIEARIK